MELWYKDGKLSSKNPNPNLLQTSGSDVCYSWTISPGGTLPLGAKLNLNEATPGSATA